MDSTLLDGVKEINYINLSLSPGLTIHTLTDGDDMTVVITRKELTNTNGNNKLLKKTQIKMTVSEYLMLKSCCIPLDSVINYNFSAKA